MATVFKRGKFYHHYYTDAQGKQRKRSTGLTSKKQAQEEAEAFVARIKVGKLRGYDADLQLYEAIDSYEAAGKGSRFLDKLAANWGQLKIRTIRPAWVRAHAKDLYPNVLPSTLNRQVITPLQAVINHAYQAEDGRQIKIEKFAIDPKKKQAVDADWHKLFAEHAVSFGMAAMARFMFETAARVSEACRVQPEDIDLGARTVMLTKTKTKPRITRISPTMATMLERLMSEPRVMNRLNKKSVNGVFGYSTRHAVYNGWKTTCDRAGIAYSPPHSSGRVSFATELVVRKGIDPVTAAKLGGWASPKVMMDTYAKSDGGHQIIDDIFGDKADFVEQTTPNAEPVSTNSNNVIDFNDLKAKKRSLPR